MKIKDIKETLEFLNKDSMPGVREVIKVISRDCPNHVGIKRAKKCLDVDSCLECWECAIELQKNQDKLENKI